MTEDSKTTVLTIEDEAPVRMSIAAYLEDHGFKVLEAENGRIGLEVFRREAPDLILVDLRMPEVDGLEVLSIVAEESPPTPTIVVSGTGVIGDAIEALHRGAWDYVLKPIEDMEVMLHAIRKALEKSRLLIENKRHQEDLEELVRMRTAELDEEIDERKRTEESLRESEKKYRELVQSANSIIMRMDIKGKVTFFNEFAQRFFGYTEDEILGKNVIGTIVPETETTGRDLTEMIRDIGINPERYAINENENIRHNGERIWVSWTNKAIYDKNGNIIEILCIGGDLTDRKQAEDELIKEKEKFKILVEESPLGIALIAKDDTYEYINPKFVEIFGYDLGDIPTGREWLKKAFPDKKYRNEVISKWISDKKDVIKGEVRPRTYNVRCKDNSEKSIHFRDATLETGEQLLIYEDITQRKHLETQLQQSQKMEAIGTLAGGIAHDFNNILGVIIGCSELAQLDVSEGAKAHRYLKQVLDASDRAADLVQQILTFSRQKDMERRPVEVGIIFNEALKLLRSSLPSTIRIHQNIESRSGLVLADPTQMHQVLMNLCTNAAHAMREKGGILEINVTKMDFDSEEAAQHPDLRSGPYIRLGVSDTGHGMDRAMLERIFDPYFTTKKPGEGTGLGLAVVHGIVRSYAGAISVQSELGRGTTFQVFLPRVEFPEDSAETKVIAALPTGNERVLLVDDEEALVGIVKEMLEFLGYEVVDIISSIEALKRFRANPDKFDLVITDMTMPNMTGEELAQELMGIRPDIPIILCTGFSERITEGKARELGIQGFIMKPLVIHELAEKIRKVLEERKD